MVVGPHIERKKYKSPSQRHLTSAGGDTVSVGGSSIVVNHINPNSTGSPTKENEKPKASIGRGSMSSITNLDASSLASESGYQLSPDMTIAPPHNWNHKRYQVSVFDSLMPIFDVLWEQELPSPDICIPCSSSKLLVHCMQLKINSNY